MDFVSCSSKATVGTANQTNTTHVARQKLLILFMQHSPPLPAPLSTVKRSHASRFRGYFYDSHANVAQAPRPATSAWTVTSRQRIDIADPNMGRDRDFQPNSAPEPLVLIFFDV